MLMGADTNKKKVASLILARVKPSGQTETTSDPGADDASGSTLSEGERAAGEEMLSAFHAKDVDGLVSAFKSLQSIIDSDAGDSDEPSESPSGFVG